MHERKPPRGNDDDVPIIGDYSEAHDARLRPEARAPRDPETPVSPSGRARTTGGSNEDWRPDPRDVRRHANLRKQREHVGAAGKALRYAPLAIAVAVAVGVYLNFDRLRQAEVDFSPLTSLFGGGESETGPRPLFGGSPEPEVVQDAGVAGTAAPTSLDEAPAAEPVTPPPAPAPRTPPATQAPPATRQAEPAANAADAAADSEDDSPRADAAEPSADSEPPQESPQASAEPPAAAAAAEPSPEPAVPAEPPPPEPPATPETFAFGLPVIDVSEGDAGAAVIILRSGGRRGPSQITWWTTPGTATPGADYADRGKVVERFVQGEQNRTVLVPIVGDRGVEGAENFYVHLAVGESDEEVDRAEVVIADDDP